MEQNQTPIICGTNIWYGVSEGTITQEEIAGKRLIGTFTTACEFCASPNAYKSYSRLRGAIITFGKYKYGYFTHSPTEYMKLISGHEANDFKWEELSREMNAVRQIENLPNPELTQQIFDEYAVRMQQDNEPFLASHY